ncbi:GIY-YIG nuclease family protein [Corynebacterium cystitidis]|uniref:GIY-YIG nuclease family protein n=1 Tax=Corynebacterium cystitidis TaxID=35757 RepID=UPI00211DC074|nr:GIY-YIG nuclease family protein [Corynebacterium cystitidis]
MTNFDLSALDDLIADDTDGLLDPPEKPLPVTEIDRLRHSFQEINDFYREHGTEPNASTMVIAERKLGARLVGIRANLHKCEKLADMDEFGLLQPKKAPESIDDILDDEFDLLDDDSGIFDTSRLPGTPRYEHDGETAQRTKAHDFEAFEPLFKTKHQELAEGTYTLIPFRGLPTIQEGTFFILGGVMLFVAEVGETQMLKSGDRERPKERLRVIFENGTESSMYRQSLSIRLYEQNGRAVVRTGFTADEIGDADTETGHVYVLKSLSSDPAISGIENLYKIGFSTTAVEKRIAHAEKEPTYLMAPVEVVADYRVYNVRPSALEALIHRVFAPVRLEVSQIGADGRTYDPSEWFVAPLSVIDQAIDMIQTGEITEFIYSPGQQKLVHLE